ncbi:phosphonate ABC transporter substrate-binding protein [Phreatobacter sp.]|uniref:phosphonate ABC transporter substrate-binding protein n=1 Tax=Phreatobacter sp. TaxID=1966341 RepID=UPI003F708450
MLARRLVLAAAATLALAAPVLANDWRRTHPELVFSIIPSENSGGVLDRYGPFVAYLSSELGVKVTLRIANDYAAVIEGLRTGQVHFAHLGPSAYARAAIVTEGAVEPLVTMANSQGAIGYYSVLYVRTGDSARTVQDLAGRNLCLVDPNSASGNNVPRFALNRLGIVPETHFAKVVYAGSHENAVVGLMQGTCDAAFNWWNTERESNLLRMAAKGMVKAEDVRIVFRSDLIPGSPITMMRAMPEPMRAAVRQAFLDAAEKGREAFLRISDGNATRYEPVKTEDYQVMVDLTRFIDQMRRRRS